jgi:lysophospholipase L1-like esterase
MKPRCVSLVVVVTALLRPLQPEPAAFHPTPAGQKAIASHVESVVAKLFK